jgi:hypothetical protein
MMAATEERSMTLTKLVLTGLLALALLFASGFAFGAAMGAATNSDPNWGRVALSLAASLVVGAGAVWGLKRLKPWQRSDEPVSPNTRKANNLMLASGAIGAVIGVVFVLSTVMAGERPDPLMIVSNGPLAAWVAGSLIALWLVVMPLVYFAWLKAVDEHELQAYNFGGAIALHLYYFILPAWWVGWRGGFLPEISHAAIFAVVTVAWCIGWFWRRYR